VQRGEGGRPGDIVALLSIAWRLLLLLLLLSRGAKGAALHIHRAMRLLMSWRLERASLLLLLLLLLWVTSRGGEKVEVCGRGCWCWCADCGCSAEGLFVVSSGVVWADVSEERAVRMEGDGERGLARRAGGSGEGTAAAACRARASRCRRCRYC